MKRLSVYLFALAIATLGVACSERSNQTEQENQDPYEMEQDTAAQDTALQDTAGQDTLSYN